MLERAGITSLEQLRDVGSVAAYARVRLIDGRASLNLLWAMEGALSGDDWRSISRKHRTSLLLALEQLEKGAR
jgi:TfoX C-terminal domain